MYLSCDSSDYNDFAHVIFVYFVRNSLEYFVQVQIIFFIGYILYQRIISKIVELKRDIFYK